MKTICPKCDSGIDIPDSEIIDYILRESHLCYNIASALGKMTGGKTKLDAAGRRRRALNAVRAREAKRTDPTQH